MSFKRKTNWICFGLYFNVYLSLLLHFLLVYLHHWHLSPLASMLFYKMFHLLVSCCYCSQFQFMISIRFVSLEMNDPSDKIHVITTLQLLFHSLTPLETEMYHSLWFISYCPPFCLDIPSDSFLYKLLNLCWLFCPWFDFPKNKKQPVPNMQVRYSVTFCYLLVYLTSK